MCAPFAWKDGIGGIDAPVSASASGDDRLVDHPGGDGGHDLVGPGDDAGGGEVGVRGEVVDRPEGPGADEAEVGGAEGLDPGGDGLDDLAVGVVDPDLDLADDLRIGRGDPDDGLDLGPLGLDPG